MFGNVPAFGTVIFIWVHFFGNPILIFINISYYIDQTSHNFNLFLVIGLNIIIYTIVIIMILP